MTTVNYINALMEISGCVLCAVVGGCLCLGKRPRDLCGRLYLQMLCFNTGTLLFDFLALVFRGGAGVLSWWGVRASNFLSFSCGYLLMLSFIHYLTAFLSARVKVSRYYLLIGRVLCAVSMLLTVLTQFFPIFYYIDAGNVYHRASLFWLSQVSGIVGILLCAHIILRYRSALTAQERGALWSYILLPAAALCVQIFIYGIVLLGLVNTISLVVIFLFLQAEQGRRSAEQERELMQSRISITLSQLQPHFLYNVLNSIYYLCGSDPKMAQYMVDKFSDYLRDNMATLEKTDLIAFDEEYRHIQTYLSLEQIRFSKTLDIVYDIEVTAFKLPPLTVQPLVENAIRHGVTKKREGGVVTIATRETQDSFVITVTDTGVGFDPDGYMKDGEVHIGIRNVRQRLRSMIDGSLSVTSTPGSGTTAVVTIPKKEERRK